MITILMESVIAVEKTSVHILRVKTAPVPATKKALQTSSLKFFFSSKSFLKRIRFASAEHGIINEPPPGCRFRRPFCFALNISRVTVYDKNSIVFLTSNVICVTIMS